MTAIAPVEPVLIRCPRCRTKIDVATITTSAAAQCPVCQGTFEAIRFDPQRRAFAPPGMIDGGLAAAQPCSIHPGNAAVANCERCGSFICELCRIEVDGRTLCPGCFERLSSEGALDSTRTSFRDYSGLAGVTATAGCVVWFLCLVLGPLAIYYAVKGLKEKKSRGESDGRAGLWVAIFVGSLEIIGGIGLIVTILGRNFR